VIAATSGAILAMRLGDIDKAKKMYQIVLRADPEQKRVKTRYQMLKNFVRMLSDIEELLNKSKNHDTIKAVDRANLVLEEVLGKEAAATAGTRLLLFQCKAWSSMKFHDDAIEACNLAIEQLQNHENPDNKRVAEAYIWRAEANSRDESWDDAVADLEVAVAKVNSQEIHVKLREAKHQQSQWNKSEVQHNRRREEVGHFYVHRPHKKILDLPDNIDELDKEQKCKWLKKHYHKVSLRWHPDKVKGGKRRAERKIREASEAKELLQMQWECRGGRR